MRRSSWVIFAVVVLFCGGVFYLLAFSEPMQVISSHFEYRSDGRVYVHGEVMNRGGMNSDVNLEVKYYDNTGNALGQDTLRLKNLRPGEPRYFDSPAHSINNVKDFTILLNHRPNPYGN
jgi:hypothetical protein